MGDSDICSFSVARCSTDSIALLTGINATKKFQYPARVWSQLHHGAREADYSLEARLRFRWVTDRLTKIFPSAEDECERAHAS